MSSKKKDTRILVNPVNDVAGRMYEFDGVEYQEEFKYVSIFGSAYLLSSLGELWMATEHGWYVDKNNYSKLSYGSASGYRTYYLKDETGKKRNVRAHRLVAEHFLPKTSFDEFMKRDKLINKTDDKTNLCPQNFCWANDLEVSRSTRYKKDPGYYSKVIKEFFQDTKFNYTPSDLKNMLHITDPDAIRHLKNAKKRARNAMK